MNKAFIELPELTLKALFDYSVKEYAHRPFVQFAEEDGLTYGEFAREVEEVQKVLVDYGINSGDKVALYSENMPNWSVVYFAVVTLGAVIVPILPDFHTSEALHIATHAGCKAAFISQKLFETMLNERQPQNLNLLVILDRLHILDKLSTSSTIKTLEKFYKHKKEISTPKEEDLAAIIYTSGTTGSSKGVMLSHINLAFDASAVQHIVDIYPEDKFLSILPLAHTYECTAGMIIPLLNGASIHYIKKPPTPTVLIGAMSTVKPSFMLTVPLIIEKIYKNKILANFEKNIFIKTLYNVPFIRKKLNLIAGKKLFETFGGNLKFFGIGGAGVSPTVEAFLREAKFPYAIGYGLTETAPVLAGTNPSITKYKAIGPAMPGIEFQLREQNEKGVGTLWVRGQNVMMGYYKDEEKTAEVIDENAWFNTEDIGYIDEDGYFFMSGRAKNIIIGASGENIYPEQIEASINSHKLVSDSLVLDSQGVLTARIYLDYDKLDEVLNIKNDSETALHKKVEDILEEIRVEVNSNISSFSRIKKVIEQREEFIKTPTKKIKRYLYQ